MADANLLVDWLRVDTVLLDMDGTLLDLNFDNHFWQVHLPQRYAAARGVALETGREELMARYHARAGTLDWYSVDFWATALELDIMRLKEEVAHLIDIHPHVTDFLAALRGGGRRIVLATNAHHKSVTLKMARTGLAPHFDAIVSSHALGAAKEQAFTAACRSQARPGAHVAGRRQPGGARQCPPLRHRPTGVGEAAGQHAPRQRHRRLPGDRRFLATDPGRRRAAPGGGPWLKAWAGASRP
jgi:phosphoglycolate phosphatase-like HAD superfamily hydrolase